MNATISVGWVITGGDAWRNQYQRFCPCEQLYHAPEKPYFEMKANRKVKVSCSDLEIELSKAFDVLQTKFRTLASVGRSCDARGADSFAWKTVDHTSVVPSGVLYRFRTEAVFRFGEHQFVVPRDCAFFQVRREGSIQVLNL
jgi:hypothetical protein